MKELTERDKQRRRERSEHFCREFGREAQVKGSAAWRCCNGLPYHPKASWREWKGSLTHA